MGSIILDRHSGDAAVGEPAAAPPPPGPAPAPPRPDHLLAASFGRSLSSGEPLRRRSLLAAPAPSYPEDPPQHDGECDTPHGSGARPTADECEGAAVRFDRDSSSASRPSSPRSPRDVRPEPEPEPAVCHADPVEREPRPTSPAPRDQLAPSVSPRQLGSAANLARVPARPAATLPRNWRTMLMTQERAATPRGLRTG